ncbi:hypothetical protein ES332_A01G105000v1 [Gossypium tomentosum]|uniref:Uncharacterized protein n=1 Tax=Gossypium tomentosum TaxID=34277 RepID=A0A5D2RR47_GOSTO|nr:hypothetical protein ES332_A01G105000v1 [Gossypium tomentosum]
MEQGMHKKLPNLIISLFKVSRTVHLFPPSLQIPHLSNLNDRLLTHQTSKLDNRSLLTSSFAKIGMDFWFVIIPPLCYFDDRQGITFYLHGSET